MPQPTAVRELALAEPFNLGAPMALSGRCGGCSKRDLPLWSIDGLERCANCCIKHDGAGRPVSFASAGWRS